MIEVKLEFSVALVPKLSGYGGDFYTLPRTTFEPVKNNLDRWQSVPAAESFVDEYFDQQSFDRICSYDRAGYSWSDPGPKPRRLGISA